MKKRAILAGCLALIHTVCLGQMQFTSQNRSVGAGKGVTTNATDSAPDAGPWTSTVSHQISVTTSASASQTSSLNPYAISMSASVRNGRKDGDVGFGRTQLTTSFVALRTMTFSLSWSALPGSGAVGQPQVSLSGPGLSGVSSGGSLSTTGVLIAGGTYTLQASLYSADAENNLTASRELRLDITSILDPIGTAFTVQGVAARDGVALDGSVDMRFRLSAVDDGTMQLGPTLERTGVPVQHGVFSQRLDFGDVFDGNARWLEMAIREPSGEYRVLGPRTRLDAVPNAAFATLAGAARSVPWTGVSNVPSDITLAPWHAMSGGIEYADGSVRIGGVSPELKLSVAGGLRLGTGQNDATIAFGAIGDGLGSAENTDLIKLQRVTVTTGATNQSELRLFLGDDPTTSNNSQDSFVIGTNAGGTWSPSIVFRSDGVASKPGGGFWAALCDPRAKHDITPLRGTLDRLLSLRGYQYFYNDAEINSGRALPGLQIGLMADEVERVFPDWISRDRDGMRMVTERSTTALMVEALRDLRAEKDEQIKQRDKKIASQGREIEELKARLQRIEDMLKTR